MDPYYYSTAGGAASARSTVNSIRLIVRSMFESSDEVVLPTEEELLRVPMYPSYTTRTSLLVSYNRELKII